MCFQSCIKDLLTCSTVLIATENNVDESAEVSQQLFGDDMANDMPSITHTHSRSRKGYSNAFAIRAMRLIIVAGALLSPFKVGQ